MEKVYGYRLLYCWCVWMAAVPLDFQTNVAEACIRLKEAKNRGSKLLILTGAGMSVTSGVPVFRNADGSMHPDFLRFLGDYNAARKRHGLAEADDWFDFSVPEMFNTETAPEAWKYWRWRVLRALVEPAEDYKNLMKLLCYFGEENVFICTSNCDMLHERAGMSPERVLEIHGSLGRLQCSGPCHSKLYPVDNEMLGKFRNDEDWYPMCPKNCGECMRPNVMIFGDHKLVSNHLDNQQRRMSDFSNSFKTDKNHVVLEIGAGVVVPSIRHYAENYGSSGNCLIRVNPSETECTKMESRKSKLSGKYFPLVTRSNIALQSLCKIIE